MQWLNGRPEEIPLKEFQTRDPETRTSMMCIMCHVTFPPGEWSPHFEACLRKHKSKCAERAVDEAWEKNRT